MRHERNFEDYRPWEPEEPQIEKFPGWVQILFLLASIVFSWSLVALGAYVVRAML